MDTLLIPLTNGGHTIIDADDWERPSLLNSCDVSLQLRPCVLRWAAFVRPSVTYARASIHGVTVYLHRLILDAPAELVSDHINHDGLDNRRVNLRLCSHAKNMGNRRKQNVAKRFKGVRWHRYGWEVGLAHQYIGRFTDEEEAARAYDAAALREYGEFALLNFPNDAFSKLGK